jgi:4-hydroxy-4-methyl-2-oxoglutarate aldolase
MLFINPNINLNYFTMRRTLLLSVCFLLLITGHHASAQWVGAPPEYVRELTSQWEGERLPDGRPHVPDRIIERLKKVSMEEAWGILRSSGYNNQYQGEWMLVNPEYPVMAGRVVTAQFMPERPDFREVIRKEGLAEGRQAAGGTNSWPIDVLSPGDVYVADSYGKIVDGTLIGDNLGTAIFTNSRNGVIFYGSVRDMQGLRAIEGFTGWIKGHDPSYLRETMLTSINAPIRIGRVTVLPGDVVLANEFGTIFIPAHLVEDLVIRAEFIMLRDEFGLQRLREGKYQPGQIDSRWSDAIREDFLNWLRNYPSGELPMTREELDEFMKHRTW